MGKWFKNNAVIDEERKYTRARYSLLLIIILSIVNMFSIIFADTYYFFSSYITFVISAIGGSLYLESGDVLFLIGTVIVGIISIVPYLVCWIFSKNKVGWLIASLVLFALDTLLLLVDTISVLDASSIINLAIHIFVVVEMVIAVKYGLKKKKEQSEEDNF